MGSKKTGRKMKSAYKKHKRELNLIKETYKLIGASQSIVASSQQAAIAMQAYTKCLKCKHSFEEKEVGGFAVPNKGHVVGDIGAIEEMLMAAEPNPNNTIIHIDGMDMEEFAESIRNATSNMKSWGGIDIEKDTTC